MRDINKAVRYVMIVRVFLTLLNFKFRSYSLTYFVFERPITENTKFLVGEVTLVAVQKHRVVREAFLLSLAHVTHVRQK